MPALPPSLFAQQRSWGSSKSQPHPAGKTKLAMGGGNRPAKLPQDSAFVRRDVGYTLNAAQASTASGFGDAVVELRWP